MRRACSEKMKHRSVRAGCRTFAQANQHAEHSGAHAEGKLAGLPKWDGSCKHSDW
jgi:hypothetical protein